MCAKKATEILYIPIAEIEVEARLRDASPTGVASLVSSIQEVGEILKPLILRKVKNGYRLLDGLHRLRAAQEVGLGVVPAQVKTCTNNDAVRIEVDANLAGAPLSALDMAVFLAAHKGLYEKEHPETKAATGADLVAKRWNTTDIMSAVSFAANAADVFGKTDRHIRRLIAVGEKLDRADIDKLRAAPKKVQFSDLETIAKCADPTERTEICAALGDGSAKSAKEVLKRKAAPNAPKNSASDERLSKLLDAWARAPMKARRSFVEQKADELRELLDDAEKPISEGEVINFATRREMS